MFNIGFGELVLILVVAFLIVGPSDLPKVAREIAKLYKKARSLWNEILAAVNLETEMEDIKKTKEDVEKTIKEINPIEVVKKEIGDITQTVKGTAKQAKEQFPQ